MKKGKQKFSESMQQVSDSETAVILNELRKILGSVRNTRGGVASNGAADGDIVEFGCYKGGTSLLIEKILEREFPESGARLWIYDSFEGLPKKSREDASTAGDSFREGELFVTKREVVGRFKKAGLRVPHIRKGFFENLDPGEVDAYGKILRGSSDLPEKICFAFLDGDLYQSIRTSLRLVTPRMVQGACGTIGGVIIVHDYNNPQLPGVAKAVDEWLASFTKTQKTAPRLQRRETLAIITW